jgi:hypothetical protein
LLASQALAPKVAPAPGSAEEAAAAAVLAIEALPINENPVVVATAPATAPSSPAPPQAPPPGASPPPSQMTAPHPATAL